MTDIPTKVTPLFGDYVPSAGTTEIVQSKADRVAALLHERKITAFGAVAIDEDGMAHMFYGREPCKGNVLVGGLELLKHVLVTESASEVEEVTKGSPDEPAS